MSMKFIALTVSALLPRDLQPRRQLGWIGAIVVMVHAGLISWLANNSQPTTRPPAPESIIQASVVITTPEPPSVPFTKLSTPPRPSPLQVAQNTRTTNAPSSSTSSPEQPEPLPAATAVEPNPGAPIVSTASTTSASSSGTSVPSSPTNGASSSTPSAPVVLPSSDAAYLKNPAPHYPRLSRRLGEEGTVVLRVLINAEGKAEKLEIATSSGHTRLDDAALNTVQTWRFVPGKRAGMPEAMWFNVPIRFVLD